MLPLSKAEPMKKGMKSCLYDSVISLYSVSVCLCTILDRLGRKEECCVFPETVGRGDVWQWKGSEGFAHKAKIAQYMRKILF